MEELLKKYKNLNPDNLEGLLDNLYTSSLIDSQVAIIDRQIKELQLQREKIINSKPLLQDKIINSLGGVFNIIQSEISEPQVIAHTEELKAEEEQPDIQDQTSDIQIEEEIQSEISEPQVIAHTEELKAEEEQPDIQDQTSDIQIEEEIQSEISEPQVIAHTEELKAEEEPNISFSLPNSLKPKITQLNEKRIYWGKDKTESLANWLWSIK